MRKGSRPKKKQTQNKILHAAVILFLEKGYQTTTTAEISAKAGYTSTMFFNAFPDKESVLYALVGFMLKGQFSMAESILKEEQDTVLLYSVETALQLHIVEISEAIRDLYVTAYTLPTTSEYIYQGVTEKLQHIFKDYLPNCATKDFYELEIASGSITRGYMAKKCDIYFTIEHKITRFLSIVLQIYGVGEEKRKKVIQRVLQLDLHSMAELLIEQTIQEAEAGFEIEC